MSKQLNEMEIIEKKVYEIETIKGTLDRVLDKDTLKAYGRISTLDQNIERQLVKFRELGVSEENTYVDKQSGKDFDREEYQNMRSSIKEGNILILDALDRLGRNYDQIIDEWRYFTRTVGADVVVLENSGLFDSRKFKLMGPMGKLLEDQLLSTLAFVAEQERAKLLQRQKEGIALAKAAGKYTGGIKRYTENNEALQEAVKAYIEGTKTVKQILNIYKSVKRSAFYEYIKENNIQRAK
jgi:DNA invertase Pin-like site-specific DNA recombinase